MATTPSVLRGDGLGLRFGLCLVQGDELLSLHRDFAVGVGVPANRLNGELAAAAAAPPPTQTRPPPPPRSHLDVGLDVVLEPGDSEGPILDRLSVRQSAWAIGDSKLLGHSRSGERGAEM